MAATFTRTAGNAGIAVSRMLTMPAIRRLADYLRPTRDLATFWHGSLDPTTFSCLSSFPYYGARLRLYCYRQPDTVPDGVIVCDAREIVRDEGLLERYPVKGKPSISKFSNHFRYRLIRQTGACWVDSDVLCLKRPDFDSEPLVFGRQAENNDMWDFNGAVLKLPRKHPIVEELAARSQAAVDSDSAWGVLGPMLITEIVRKHGVDGLSKPRSAFYPLKPGEFWKPLLPEHREEVAALTRHSTVLHLWHELYQRSKYNKKLAPAKGSYLHGVFRKLGTLDRFARTNRPDDLRTIFANRIAKDQAETQSLGA